MQVNKGYTILELLIAFTISIVFLIGFFSAIVYYENYSVEEALYKEASNILYSKLEVIKSLPYSEITEDYLNNGASSCLEAIDRNYLVRYLGNTPFKFGVFYTIKSDSTYEIKEITLSVCWKYKGKLNEISESTIVRKRK